MKTWQETGFVWEVTADGSPTLRVNGDGESMHHSGGALEETLMIYGLPVREIFASPLVKPRIFSLGLGLGYVELVATGEALRAGKAFEMLSLESVPALVQVFEDWLHQKLPEGEFKAGLDEVAARVGQALEVPAEKLRDRLQAALDGGDWRIEGALTPETLPAERFNVLLYDAFCARTCPDLWTEDFLRRLLDSCTEAECLFSSYACTGNLKRALRASGFEVVQRDGFKGKRHSTLGRRLSWESTQGHPAEQG